MSSFLTAADEAAASPYSKVDKTGVIGFLADYIEQAIDLSKNALNGMGVKNAYGFSIILFTILIKAATLPLTKTQLDSTSKMQKLQPLQAKINAKYADDETTKNQLLSQLFQAANVNPLAGCIPALVQIPIFISLYRALTNLVAEDKLGEAFLWIPDLEGPVYVNLKEKGENWITSIISGSPALGWHDTIAFLSLPFILFVSQSFSMKIMQPAKDPNKVLTDQEVFSQGILNNLPLVVAFFSINVPAGLSVYWIINNVLTTAINVAMKAAVKDEAFPIEVTQMMELVEAGPAVKKAGGGSAKQEMYGKGGMGGGGGGSTVQPEAQSLEEQRAAFIKGFGASPTSSSSELPVIDAERRDIVGEDGEEGEAGGEEASKRKKRIKPAQKKTKKDRD